MICHCLDADAVIMIMLGVIFVGGLLITWMQSRR
jgi:hypothetical protein